MGYPYKHNLELIDMENFAKGYRPVSSGKALKDYNHGIITFDFEGEIVITEKFNSTEIRRNMKDYIECGDTNGLRRVSVALNRNDDVNGNADHSYINSNGSSSLIIFSQDHKEKYGSSPYLITNSDSVRGLIKISQMLGDDPASKETFSKHFNSREEMMEGDLRYLVDSGELEPVRLHHVMKDLLSLARLAKPAGSKS